MGEPMDPLEHAYLVNVVQQVWAEYKQVMREGTGYQYLATLYCNEAESASAGYVDMRDQYRKLRGPDGFGNATIDYSYSQFAEAQKAGKDNGWYMTRSQTFSAMATMSFSKASALMASIARTEARLRG